MKTAKTLQTIAIGLALALTSAARVVADDDGGNAKTIEPCPNCLPAPSALQNDCVIE